MIFLILKLNQFNIIFFLFFLILMTKVDFDIFIFIINTLYLNKKKKKKKKKRRYTCQINTIYKCSNLIILFEFLM